jgi:hypothetical protein
VTPLQELVVGRMADLNLSFRKAAERSGGRVSAATLNAIALGRHGGNLDGEVSEGIALALGVKSAAVRRAADEGSAGGAEFVLPRKAAKLSPKERKAILLMVDALLASHED